jgi:hypothetical protein
MILSKIVFSKLKHKNKYLFKKIIYLLKNLKALDKNKKKAHIVNLMKTHSEKKKIQIKSQRKVQYKNYKRQQGNLVYILNLIIMNMIYIKNLKVIYRQINSL